MIRFRLTPIENVQPWNGDLHWFALSSGTYSIDLGTHRLLRNEYFLARLHTDLLNYLPEVLDPIPEPLAERLIEGSALVTWHTLSEATEDLDDPVFDALEGFRVRSLDSKILQWRRGDEIIIEWDHGRVAIPVETYLADLRRFHEELMAQMGERVRFATIPTGEEHRRREGELARALARPPAKYDWDILLPLL